MREVEQAALVRAGIPDGIALPPVTASLQELIRDAVDATITLDRIDRIARGDSRLFTGK